MHNLQKVGLKLFCDKIIQSPENIPVALSDQGPSELTDITTKINYAIKHENPQIHCNGFVHVEHKTAKFTFVQMMDTERGGSGMKLPELILRKLRKGPLISVQVVVRVCYMSRR